MRHALLHVLITLGAGHPGVLEGSFGQDGRIKVRFKEA